MCLLNPRHALEMGFEEKGSFNLGRLCSICGYFWVLHKWRSLNFASILIVIILEHGLCELRELFNSFNYAHIVNIN